MLNDITSLFTLKNNTINYKPIYHHITKTKLGFIKDIITIIKTTI